MSESVISAPPPVGRALSFPQPDGSEVPYRVFSSQEVYEREQERIFRGPVWSFLGLEAEIPKVGDSRAPSSATRRWS